MKKVNYSTSRPAIFECVFGVYTICFGEIDLEMKGFWCGGLLGFPVFCVCNEHCF